MMKHLIAASLVLSLSVFALIGCTEKTSVKEETKVKTPGGTTTTTIEKDVKKTGDHKTE